MQKLRTALASTFEMMPHSNLGQTALIAMLLVGITNLRITALPGAQKQASPPSEQTNPPSAQASASNPSQPAQTTEAQIEYKNTQHGFCFSLPKGWRGYSIKIDQWKGYSDSSDSDAAVQQGPLISIRHPQWTEANPRQDIPIMVFTLAQWRSLQNDEFHVSAAPIGPTELGRNLKYVFALPPRFDFAFPTGYEEVEQIVNGKSLRGDCPAAKSNKSP